MGVITLPWSMEQDRENQIKANSVHVDDNFNTLLTATNGKLEADGSIVPTADLPMGSHKITGLATPTNSADAATKGYVDSRDSTLDATYVKLSGAQTIAGVKTFSSSPVVPAPTNNTDACTKKYVDDGLAGCVKNTGNETIAGTKTFSSTITGNISGSSTSCTGNAATVTNGVYTTGNQTIGGTKTFSSTISGSINGNAATVTNGVYTTGNQTIGGTKTFSVSPIVPTPAASDNSTKVATTAWAQGHGILIDSQLPTALNDYQWYRKYSDGWVEQGGTTSTGSHTATVVFPVAMSDAKYVAQVTNGTSGTGWVQLTAKSATGMSIQAFSSDFNSRNVGGTWYVCGIAA